MASMDEGSASEGAKRLLLQRGLQPGPAWCEASLWDIPVQGGVCIPAHRMGSASTCTSRIVKRAFLNLNNKYMRGSRRNPFSSLLYSIREF